MLGLGSFWCRYQPTHNPKTLMNRGKLVGVPLMGARDYSLHYSFVLAFHDFAISFAFIVAERWTICDAHRGVVE